VVCSWLAMTLRLCFLSGRAGGAFSEFCKPSLPLACNVNLRFKACGTEKELSVVSLLRAFLASVLQARNCVLKENGSGDLDLYFFELRSWFALGWR